MKLTGHIYVDGILQLDSEGEVHDVRINDKKYLNFISIEGRIGLPEYLKIRGYDLFLEENKGLDNLQKKLF